MMVTGALLGLSSNRNSACPGEVSPEGNSYAGEREETPKAPAPTTAADRKSPRYMVRSARMGWELLTTVPTEMALTSLPTLMVARVYGCTILVTAPICRPCVSKKVVVTVAAGLEGLSSVMNS